MSSSIDQELKTISDKLAALELEKRTLINRQQELIQRRSSSDQQVRLLNSEMLSADQKVELFLQYFKGRTDVYAVRWENKQGKSGYSVACDNEWKPGVCHKPKIKCNECQHRKLSTLKKDVIYDHLAGKHTIGLYPLLTNDHCWFLAVDFDKADWQVAISAFINVCSQLELPYAIERSRSGNGAHVWLFFESAILAQTARNLGFLLLDKAMEAHAELTFDSYDRLFPNQDTMPVGGFGNLIALPLQHGPRQLGNSVFVDEKIIPYSNQWEFLASLNRLSLKRINEILEQLERKKDCGVNLALKPWEKGLPIKKSSIDGCPKSVPIVLANRIYILIKDLPQALQALLKRLASFSNPVFFKTQALRFSTNGIPRFICTAYFDQGYLSLPRGCIDAVVKLLKEHSIECLVEDKRFTGNMLKSAAFKGSLRKDQKKAVSALNAYDVGILHAPTAFGKTITAIGMIIKRKVNTLILVHSRQLLDQWKERLLLFCEGVEIGTIGGGKRKSSGQVDVATYQSLIKRTDNSVDEVLFDYGQVIIDECHHISAPRYESLISEIRAKYVLGMTATLQRRDGHQPIIFMQAGPIRYQVKDNKDKRFERRVIVKQIDSTPPVNLCQSDKRVHIADVYRWLMNDEERNKQIVNDVLKELNENRSPLVLTERREHVSVLSEMLIESGLKTLVLKGAMNIKERKSAMNALSEAEVLVATGKYIGEGFDWPKLDILFLALPISWKGSLMQYAGRIHRITEDKEQVTIYDYVDTALPTLQRMYQKRYRGYRAMDYGVCELATDDNSIQTVMPLGE